MKLLAIKVDSSTYRGTRDGVPRLVNALRARSAGASFFFGLGPDHTGRWARRLRKACGRKKAGRICARERYGWTALWYGTLALSPDIGRCCAEVMRSVRDAGFETGIQAWNPMRWRFEVAKADQEWTLHELDLASRRYADILGEPAQCHAAANWQLNRTALRWQQQSKLRYASDTRGQQPFWPLMDGELVRCLQLPTTLPTLDELVGQHGLHSGNVVEHVLEQTAEAPDFGHVFTAHSEIEGAAYLPQFEQLLDGWLEQGYQLVALRDLYQSLPLDELPYHEICQADYPGHSNTLAQQGAAFPHAM